MLNAFPPDMKGRYCEKLINDGKTVAILVLDAKATSDLLREDPDDPYGWRGSLEFNLEDISGWVYKIDYFEVEISSIRDDPRWFVADYARNCSKKYYPDYNSLFEYVNKSLGVEIGEFKKDSDISLVPMG